MGALLNSLREEGTKDDALNHLERYIDENERLRETVSRLQETVRSLQLKVERAAEAGHESAEQARHAGPEDDRPGDPEHHPVALDTTALVAEFHEAFCPEQTGKYPEIETARYQDFDLHMHAIDLAAIAKKLWRDSAFATESGEYDVRFTRMQLLTEELAELCSGLASGDLTETLDALSDLQYVLDGTYLAFSLHGIKGEAFEIVHRSNMSKLGDDGRPIVNEAGRVVKGPNYEPPDLGPLVGRLVDESV